MCGIAGILDPNNRVDENELRAFTLALHHRGPDGHGTQVDGNVGLGQTRLAILDLSDNGKCPMPYQAPNGSQYWITFNGEVFNFIELRAELQMLGFTFKSESDTEVVVAAYAAWGEKSFLKMNGMWGLAIWDVSKRELIVCRDRFGVKPVFFRAGNRFEFASELKAFLQLKNFTPKLNTQSALQILANPYSFEGKNDQTLIEGIQKLPGGCMMKVTLDGKLTANRWWNTHEHFPHVPAVYAEQVEMFREIFLDAVRIRMRSDVPIATCLSGGIDSSAVASSLALLQGASKSDLSRCATDWQNTFIATFPGTMIDEQKYADEVVRHIGAKPHYLVFDENKALEAIPHSIWSLDDVVAGVVTPVWNLYKKLRENKVVVSIDGHGSDELFGGYAWYLDTYPSKFNDTLYDDFHINVLPPILRNFDRCSTAHGIEVRMPFMDWRLVTMVMALPPDSKMGGGFTKRILRDAMKGIMPESIRTRRQKIGFNSPLIEWFNGALTPFFERVSSHRHWLESPFFDGRSIREQVLAKSRAQAWRKEDWDTAMRIMSLVNFVVWQMLFIDNDKSILTKDRRYDEISSSSLVL